MKNHRRINTTTSSHKSSVRLPPPPPPPPTSTATLRLTPLRAAALTTTSTAALLYAVAEYDERCMIQEATNIENRIPLVYDASAIASFWNEHSCIAICRVCAIGASVLPFLAKCGVSYWWKDNWTEKEQSTLGVELRDLLTKLGPTFIKFGQMVSIRPDILPTPVLVELQKLCDAVPPFPTKEAIALIERELGNVPISTHYDGLTIDSTPIAAASLGQVYKCTLASDHSSGLGGLSVAVKVQRPDMVRAVSLDLYVLRKYTSYVESFKTILMKIGVFVERKQFDVELLDTFAHASFYELDYVHEAANQERFAKHLHTTNVYVPDVYHDWTTRRVLTTEWIEGEQLAKSSPETIRRLIPCGVECFLHQLLSIGFFHSDPHPGNLLVNDRGQLVLIDFGLCAEVGQPDTKGMTSAIVHLMQGDVAALVDDAIALRFLPEDVDKEMLLPSLQAVFDRAQLAEKEMMVGGDGGFHSDGDNEVQHNGGGDGDGGGNMVLPPRTFDFKTQERRAQFKHISRDLNKIFYDFPFVVPEYFALITRALIVLEGIAVTGDPNFDIFAAAYPFASSRAVELFGWSGVARIGAAAVVGGGGGAKE